MKLTDTTPEPRTYAIVVRYGSTHAGGFDGWHWSVHDMSEVTPENFVQWACDANKVASSSRLDGYLTRWGATWRAKRAVRRLVRQRTRTLTVTV